MSQCKLKSQLDKAEKERRELLVKAQNEILLTSILTANVAVNSNPVNAEIVKAMLDTFEGAKEFVNYNGKKSKKSIYQLALAVNTAYLPNEKSAEDNKKDQHAAVAALLNAINGNKDVSLRMRTLRASTPDPKYTRINLSQENKDVSLSDQIVNQLQAYIATDSKIANRIKRLKSELNSLVEERNSGIKSNTRADYVESRIKHIHDQFEKNEDGTLKIVDEKPVLTFNDIKQAVKNAEKVLNDDANNFLPIYMIHNADSHYLEGTDQKKTMEYRNTIEKALGYDFTKLSNLQNEDNDIVANSNGVLSSHEKIGDELSAIGILFGKSVIKETVVDKDGKESVRNTVKDIFAHVPEFLKNSIKINAIERMADVYKVLGYEQGSEDFDKLWGISPGNMSYDEDVEKIAALPAGSIPASFIVQGLGKAIYKSLPIKFSHEVSTDLEQKAITELGLYGIEFMHNSGLAKYGITEVGEGKDIKEELQNVVLNDGKKKQIILRVNIDNNEVLHDHQFIAPNKVNDLVLALQHMSLGKDVTGVSDSPIVEQSKTVRNSILGKPKSVKAKVENMQSKPLQFTSDMITLDKLYKKDRNLAYAFAGILEPQGKNIGDKIKSLAKINYEKMMLDDMMEQYYEYGVGNNFYLKYDYTVSGRYMIDAILNPQTSKITRFLVTSGSMNEEKRGLQSNLRVENGVYDQDDLDNFKTSVAQAFDLDPDKKSDKDTNTELEKIVEIKNNGDVIFKHMDGKNVFLNAFNQLKKLDGELDFLNTKNSDIENAKSDRTAFIKAMKEATDKGGFHTVQALMALKAFSEHKLSDGDHRSNITLESDAITSGMILTLIGIGTEDAINFASKGGIYTDEVKKIWKSSLDALNDVLPQYAYVGLKDANGEFKLTHGWLRSYVAHIKNVMENDPKAAEIIENGKYQTKFADFYETVASDANEEMQKIKKEINGDPSVDPSDFIKYYGTLAVAINALNNAEEKGDASPEYIASLKAKVEKLKDINAMIDVVGSIKRSTAKPAVMVYIYGAMLSSIKKKLTGAIAVPKLYEILNELKDKNGNSITFDNLNEELSKAKSDHDLNEAAKRLNTTASALRIVKLALSSYLLEPQVSTNDSTVKYNIYVDEFGNEISVPVEDNTSRGSNVQKRPLFQEVVDGKLETVKDFGNKHLQTLDKLVISGDMVSALQSVVNGSLGEAFEKGFQQFKFIDEYRDSVKTLEVVRFSIFKYKYRKAIDHVKKTLSRDENGNYQIGNADISRIIAELEKEGYGHSVDDINGGKQSLYKKEDLEKEIRMVLLTATEKGSRPRTSAIEGKDYGPNTGASGVITVHSIDGLVDSTSSAMFNLIRIYDGSVSGTDSLISTLDSYNETMFQAFDWSSYNTQANLLQQELHALSESGEIKNIYKSMLDLDKDALINTIEKLMGYNDIEAIDLNHDIPLMQKKVDDRIKESIVFRKDGKREVDINHSYLTDKAHPVRKKVGMLAKKNIINKDATKEIYDFYKALITELQVRKRFNKFGEEGEPTGQLAYAADSKKIITKENMPRIYKDTMEANGKASTVVYPDNAAKNGSNGAGAVQYGKTTNVVGIPVYKDNLNSRSESQWQEYEVDEAIRLIGNAFDRIPRDRGIIFTYHKDKNGVIIYDLLHKVENPKIQEYIAKRINEFMFGTEGYKHVDEYSEPQGDSTSSNPLIRVGIKRSDMKGNAAKDIAMAEIATQFIGEKANPNIAVSSTEKYKKAFGKNANTGIYTSDDIVMISGSGPWRGVTNADIHSKFKTFYIPLLDKAIVAESKIVVGSAAGIDQLVIAYLKDNGYKVVFDKNVEFNKAIKILSDNHKNNNEQSIKYSSEQTIVDHDDIYQLKSAYEDLSKYEGFQIMNPDGGLDDAEDFSDMLDRVIRDNLDNLDLVKSIIGVEDLESLNVLPDRLSESVRNILTAYDNGLRLVGPIELWDKVAAYNRVLDVLKIDPRNEMMNELLNTVKDEALDIAKKSNFPDPFTGKLIHNTSLKEQVQEEIVSTDAAKEKVMLSHEIIKKAFIDSMKGIIPSKDAAVIADEVIKDC